MGKCITAAPDIVTKLEAPTEELIDFDKKFYKFLIDAMNSKGAAESLEALDVNIQLVRKLKASLAELPKTVTLENDEFKALSEATKKFLPTMNAQIQREYREFYRALEPHSEKNPGGVQDVELATKK